MPFKRYVYVQRISMGEKQAGEIEGRSKRMIDAIRLSVYLTNIMDHGLTSAFWNTFSPLEKTNARENIENYSWRKILDPEMLTSSVNVISYATFLTVSSAVA